MAQGYKSLPGVKTLLTGGSSAAGTSGLASTLLGGAGAILPWAGPVLLAAQFLPQLFGRGRKQADLFGEIAQKPITGRLSAIVDEAVAARRAGTLTYDQAQAALEAFNTQADEFERAAAQFETLGTRQRIVAGQARSTVNPLIDEWRKGLQTHIDALTPTSRTNAEAPTMGTLLAPLGQTPEGQARKRADQERKRMASGGLRSTLMTGPSGLRSAAPGQRRTLLGY